MKSYMTYLASLTEEMEDKVRGYYIIKTKKELDNVVADNKSANKVIIRSDFAQEYFTPSGLKRYLTNARYVNRNLTIELDGTSEVVTDYSFISRMARALDFDTMFSLLVTYPKEFMDAIKTLTSGNIEERNQLLAASNKVASLQSIIDAKNVEIENLNHALAIEESNKLNAQSKLDVLIKRINYQYNAGVDESKLFSVDENNFDKVIYIKEVTRVQYVDSLVYYLKEILKILYTMPTRLLVVEGYYASGKIRLYPDLVPHHKLKEGDVLSGDILMLGMQPRLMQDILHNPSNISVLIVLDRGGYTIPHIKGKNVEYFYTASDINDIPEDVPKSRIISYSEDTLYIPLIEDFDKCDAGEKMTKYSSTEIVKRIIALIEGR